MSVFACERIVQFTVLFVYEDDDVNAATVGLCNSQQMLLNLRIYLCLTSSLSATAKFTSVRVFIAATALQISERIPNL